ncbi:MAG: EAL domain-containing protein [Pseudomonadota bacterium]
MSPQTRAGMNPPTFIAVMLVVALAIAVSRLVSATGDVSLVWPPLGIAFGLALERGRVGVAVVLCGLALWVLASGQSPLLLVVAVPEIVLGVAVALFLHRTILPAAQGALAGVTRLYLAGVVGGAAVSALIGATGFHLVGLYRDVAFGELFFAFWVTEAMGVMLFAPFARAVAHGGFPELWVDRALAWRWLLAVAIAFTLVLLVRTDIRDVAVLLTGLLIAWPAMRARPAFLHFAVLVMATMLLAVALHAGADTSNRAVLELVLRLAALTVLAQLLNAVSVERTDMLQRERELARRDALTGLGNERALRERLSTLRASDGSLLLVRIEDMPGVVDLLGSAAAEELERTLAGEFAQRCGDDAARLDRGRYALLLRGQGADAARDTARTLYAGLDNRMFLGDEDRVALRPTLAVVPIDDRDPGDLLLAADQALAVAATCSGERLEIAAGARDLLAVRRDLLRRQEQVKVALQEQRFVLYAQPIVPLAGPADGLHCEILLRLREPDGSILAPGHFLPAAERAQLTGDIDRYVIERLLAWLARHPEVLGGIAKCAINLTGWSASDASLPAWIRHAVASYGIPAHKLCFEITETQAIASRDNARRLIDSLREIGASVSLDDFGTGLATFDYLKAFPFDYLKIDGSFIRTLQESPVDQAVVRAMADVAKTMRLRTIAEFVENDALVVLLRDMGVDYAQGYGVGKPRPLAELLGLDPQRYPV